MFSILLCFPHFVAQQWVMNTIRQVLKMRILSPSSPAAGVTTTVWNLQSVACTRRHPFCHQVLVPVAAARPQPGSLPLQPRAAVLSPPWCPHHGVPAVVSCPRRGRGGRRSCCRTALPEGNAAINRRSPGYVQECYCETP